MPNLYHEVQAIAASGKKILVNFSRGRDSLVQAHILLRTIPKDRLVFCHQWTYPDLEYQLKHLRICEQFFGVPIHRVPSNERGIFTHGKLQESSSQERDRLLTEFECDLAAYGLRMDETLGRRNRLRKFVDGINEKDRECYPIKSWTAPVIRAYATKNKLPLAEEYAWNIHDIGARIVGDGLLWLLERHPEDFARAAKCDPILLSEYTKLTGKIV